MIQPLTAGHIAEPIHEQRLADFGLHSKYRPFWARKYWETFPSVHR